MYSRKTSRAYSTRASSGGNGHRDSGPFGAAMAQEIFGFSEYDPWTSVDISYESDVAEARPVEEEWYQTELPLKNIRELESELISEIEKWKMSYHRMMVFALKRFYLMEEVEENPQIKKMFNDMQMMRKLGGSDRV